MSYNLMGKSEINNFHEIIKVIEEDYNFEHLGHIIHYLDRFDKDRKDDDPELKDALFTVVKEILDRGIATPLYSFANMAPLPDPTPENSDGTLEYLDKYWGNDTDENVQTKRDFLLFFQKKVLPPIKL